MALRLCQEAFWGTWRVCGIDSQRQVLSVMYTYSALTNTGEDWVQQHSWHAKSYECGPPLTILKTIILQEMATDGSIPFQPIGSSLWCKHDKLAAKWLYQWQPWSTKGGKLNHKSIQHSNTSCCEKRISKHLGSLQSSSYLQFIDHFINTPSVVLLRNTRLILICM